MRLHFKKFGNGYPLIILHGLYGSGDNWFTMARKLSNHFSVYLPDLRNHGSSPHHPDLNFEVMTSDLHDLFEVENIKNAYLAGHSMGGKVAMNFSLSYPDKVKKLVVIDVAIRSYIEADGFDNQARFHQKIIQSLLDLDITGNKKRTDIDKQLAKSLPHSKLRQFLLKNLKRKDEGELYWGTNITSIKNHFNEIMAGIETQNRFFYNPVLVISGLQSGYVVRKDHVAFKELFPSVLIKELDSGHWIHADQPEKLYELLHEFLTEKG